MPRVLTAEEAVKDYIYDGATIATSGFVGAVHAETISAAVQKLFLETGHPRDLTLMWAAGQGDSGEKGLNHFGEEGLLKCGIGGHWGLQPRMQKLALENKFAAYNLPQGVISHMFRDIAAAKVGVITHVGLNTFVDPRLEGGKLNEKAREMGDIVEVINIEGKDLLMYKTRPVDVAIIRATFADEKGNCTMHKEGVFSEALSIAMAAKNSGGKVIVEVEQLVAYGSLDPRLVKIPGAYIDAIVVAENPFETHKMTNGSYFNPAFTGEVRIPVDRVAPLPMGDRKIIARRAAMELVPDALVNLGIGMPEGVATICAEEGLKGMVLTTESGTIGGVPAAGGDFGVTINPDCVLDQPYQFDFYDGGGLDVAFLGLAQTDKVGNINVSKFGPKIAGCGGFINITQNSRKVVYCGTFTTGGLKVHVEDNKLVIDQEGKVKKFVDTVEQITFSGKYAARIGQPVLYITERAVFKLGHDGVELIEVAPGIDIQTQILDQMDFRPIIKGTPKTMDTRIFSENLMGLSLE